MTYTFKIKQPLGLILYLACLHLFVAICLYNFLMPAVVKVALILIIFLSLSRYFYKYLCEVMIVSFHPLTQRWSVSVNGQKSVLFDQIRTIYLNKTFLWVILQSKIHGKLTLITSAESLTEDKYKQLRRYIISPGLFKSPKEI